MNGLIRFVAALTFVAVLSTAENRVHRRVPVFDVSRADTLASIDRIEASANSINGTNGRIVVQHSLDRFDALPRFPAHFD